MDRKGALGWQIFGIFKLLLFMIIVGGGIAFGTYLFYGKGYDFREAEAGLLNYKIRNCIMENEIDKDFFNNEFFEKCGLDREVINKTNIIKVCKDSADCIGESRNENILFQLKSNFVACGLPYKKAPIRCVSAEFVKGADKFNVIVGSWQASRRISG